MNELGLVPKLRFPEFLEAGEWMKRELGNLIEIKGRIGYRGYTIEDIVAEGRGAISLSPSNISDTGELSFSKLTYISWDKYEESPEIMLKAGFTILVKTGSSYGKAALIQKLPTKSTINPQLVVLKPIRIDSVFLFFIISNALIQKQIKENIGGGAIPTLSQENISKFNIFVPCQKEQQKIAACLSSLDDLITAENQKLDALKRHKKGLMQQLFPAEGETVPKLRFPEFLEAGAWEEKRLVDICKKISQGGTPDTSNPSYWNGSVEWLTPAEMGKMETRFIQSTVRKITEIGLKNCSSDLLPINSIIISTRAPIGHLAVNKSKMAINQGCKGLVPKDSVSYDFLYYLLFISKSFLIDLGAGNTFKELSGNTLKNFEILLPSFPEQQKIAACLSSLDDLITAQSKKIDTLKKHKQGLMQQLFPQKA